MQRTTFLYVIVASIAFAEAFAEANDRANLEGDTGSNMGPSGAEGNDEVGKLNDSQSLRSRRDVDKLAWKCVQYLNEAAGIPFPNRIYDRNGYFIGNRGFYGNRRHYANGDFGRFRPFDRNGYGTINGPYNPMYPLYPNRGQPGFAARYPFGDRRRYRRDQFYPNDGFGQGLATEYPSGNPDGYGPDPRYANDDFGQDRAIEYPSDSRDGYGPNSLYPNEGYEQDFAGGYSPGNADGYGPRPYYPNDGYVDNSDPAN